VSVVTAAQYVIMSLDVANHKEARSWIWKQNSSYTTLWYWRRALISQFLCTVTKPDSMLPRTQCDRLWHLNQVIKLTRATLGWNQGVASIKVQYNVEHHQQKISNPALKQIEPNAEFCCTSCMCEVGLLMGLFIVLQQQ
jgi:hypothetical protein